MRKITEDLKANDADKFFDNICGENGQKLAKSAKRTKLMQMMRDLYYNRSEENKCTLSTGETVPLIIAKRHPKRGEFCYFNTSSAPVEEILQSFADKMQITCKLTRPMPKKEGELIVADIKNLVDNVTINGKKVSDVRKQQELNRLFYQLYHTPEENICKISDGNEIPIIVERLSVNNWNTLCLNTSEHRTDVLSAFAAWAGCTYCQEKENAVTPPEKHPHEMTARQCARIFHGVPNLDGCMAKRDASPKLVEWFAYIYNKPTLNNVTLPNGKEVPLLVHRISHSQKCLCLNTSDEKVKPFVIKRMSEITEANICLDNLKIYDNNLSDLHKAVIMLKQAEQTASNPQDVAYYQMYAEKAWRTMTPASKAFNVAEWLAEQKGRK